MPQHEVNAFQNLLTVVGIKTYWETRDPTAADTGFRIPTLWINSSSNTGFILVTVEGGAAVWIDLGDSSLPTEVDDFYAADTAPPGAPAAGDAYILDESLPVDAGWTAVGATNDDIVVYGTTGWVVHTPPQGRIIYVVSATDFYIYDGAAWGLLSSAISGLTYVANARMPYITDNTHVVPTVWLDTVLNESWILVDVTLGIATWLKLGASTLGDAQDSVLSRADGNNVPPTENAGDRYIVYDGGGGVVHANWDGAAFNDLCTFDGNTWVAKTADEGMFCEVEDENTVYIFVTAWEKFFQSTGAKFGTDAGDAIPDATGVLNIIGTAAQGLTFAGATNNVTGTVADATAAQKGVATFDAYDFVVAVGDVTLRPAAQFMFVGKWGNDAADGLSFQSAKLTIQACIDAITDNAVDKPYVIMIYTGTYTEDIVMEDYVSLKGIGQPTSVIITGTNSAPLLTFDADASQSFVENIRLQLTPTADAQSLVAMSNGTHKFEGCHFYLTSATQDIGATCINQTGGTLFIDNSNLTYTMTAVASTAAKEHIILNLSGTHTTKVVGLIRTLVSIADTDDNFTFVKEIGTTTKLELRNIDSDVSTTNAAHTGTVKFLDTTAVGIEHTRELSNNAIDFIQTTGTPNNFCYPYVIDSTSNDGHIHSSGNVIHADGYGTSTFATIATGDTVLSHFDDVEIDTKYTGVGTFTYSFSHADGEFDTETINLTSKINLEKDLDTMAVGELLSGWDAVIDASDTTGGDYGVLNVSLTEASGGADICAVKTGTGVKPVCQNIGATVAADKCWSVDSAAWTDRTIAFGSAATDVQIFNADNDVIYIGDVAMYNTINFIAATVASVDLKFTFEYWNGAWTTFTPNDDTNGFRATGDIQLPDLSGDWATTQVNGEGDGPWYYIRLTRTKNHIITAPTEDTIKITSTTGGVYYWNENGDLSIKGIALDTVLTVPNGGTGLATITDHCVLVGSGVAAITPLTAATNGQLVIGSTGADPAVTSLTTGTGITATNGAGTLTLDLAAGLVDIAGLAVTDSNFIVGDGLNWVAETGATARTSLGLGSIATQDANNVNIDGGNIDGTIIGAASAAAATVTNLTAEGFDGAYSVAVNGGWVSNLGLKYSGSVLSVTGADGTALSAANPGYVIMQDRSSPGQLKKYAIIADQGFIDDTGASEIPGNLFGLTSGIAYAEDIPFFIYAVTNDAEDAVAFMTSRVPGKRASPTVAYIGAPDDAVADTQFSFFSFENLTEADYDSNPAVMIGSFRMTMSAADDWTVTTLDLGDGIGRFQEAREFTVPTGSFDAAAGKLVLENGGTAPTFSTNLYYYRVSKDGWCTCEVTLDGDGGTDGAGGVSTLMVIPYVPTRSQFIGSALIQDPVGVKGHMVQLLNTRLYVDFVEDDDGGIQQLLEFTHGVRYIQGQFRYKIAVT